MEGGVQKEREERELDIMAAINRSKADDQGTASAGMRVVSSVGVECLSRRRRRAVT